MVDGVGVRIGADHGAQLLNHPDLEWQGQYSLRTAVTDEAGILVNRFGPKNCMIATHYQRSGETFIRGSLHCFYQDGSNWQDLSAREARDAISYFGDWLGVPLGHMSLTKLECGVAFSPPTTTQDVTDRLICSWSGSPFVPMHGRHGAASVGRELRRTDTRLKVYDQAALRDLDSERMKVEDSLERSRRLHREDIYTLGTLILPGVIERCAHGLFRAFDELVINDPVYESDPDISGDPVFLASLRAPTYWKGLPRTTRHRQRRRLQQAVDRNPGASLTANVRELLREQVGRMCR